MARAAALGIEAGVWRTLFRWHIFYPLAALTAAAVILISLGPALLPRDARPVSGQMVEGALWLAREDIAHPLGAPETVHFVVRDGAWEATGLRVAARMGVGALQPEETGAQILINPEAALALGEGPFRIEIRTAPVPVTTAPQVAIALERGGFREWATAETPLSDSTIAVDFPASDPGVLISSIGIRPIAALEDYHYGVEIRSIRIVPTRSPAS
ncbi:MAG: hypothetical protein AB7L65_04515 [Hyphomonadaceae bacterium]